MKKVKRIRTNDDSPTVEQFLEEATPAQVKDFLSYCAENKVFPAEASLANHLAYIEYNHKIQLCAKRLLHDGLHTEVYFLVKYLIDLRDELNSFIDSEGYDTQPEVVHKVNLWIKENIDNEKE